MMIINRTFLLISLILSLSVVHAEEFQTLTYYMDDSTKLELDLFMPDSVLFDQSPVLIYVHGGGFSNGNRTAGHNLCEYLSEKGFVSASITYRLYMKDKSFSCDGILSEKIKAIQYAANHLWLATRYFIEQKDIYEIDTGKIFVAGSSAGAETVLHGAFWDYEMMNMYSDSLPKHFKYAGLIAGAGAIMDLNLITTESMIPVMMFHGNNDPLVPYGTAAHHYCETNAPGWLMFFGSYSIYNHITTLGGTTELMTYCGGGHEIAGKHFYKEIQPVYAFLLKVLNNEKFQEHQIINTGKHTEMSSGYKFCVE